MKLTKLLCISLLLMVLFFLSTSLAVAAETSRFITVVNPVRISQYNKFPGLSLKNEYEVIKENKIAATWLLTYDALKNASAQSEIKKMDDQQEFGVFLEVTPVLATDSGVIYHNSGSWHHADSVFLSGYTQEERRLLIDKIFQVFKEEFGYFPTSVGSWWTDGFSLSYMKEKFGITANLVCSDQYSTDGYQIWGQPWALPYYPNKTHPAVPASSTDNKLGVVNIQWAPRDPLHGYESSLYSTQDYTVLEKPLDINYFKKLVDLYSSFGQITVGLESDLDPWVYEREYKDQIEYVENLKQNGVGVTTMSGFAKWYFENNPGISPSSKIESEDLLGGKIKAFWYSGPKYRLFYTKEDDKIVIKDIRIYDSELTDPYYLSPNRGFTLSINTPYLISYSEDPNDAWELPQGAEINASDNFLEIKAKGLKVPGKINNSKMIKLEIDRNKVKILFVDQRIPGDGLIYKDFSAEAIHFFRTKKALFSLLTGKGWNFFNKINYQIPQGEVYALRYLESLSGGRVLVYDNECLQCEYHTEFPIPSIFNRRNYVKEFSDHPIVYNKSVFTAKDRPTAKSDLLKTGVKYIYLVKFEGYSEKLPFSPGDLGVARIFNNANAEIWEVKK